MHEENLICRDCGEVFPADRPLVVCENCDGLLEVTYDLEELSSGVNMEGVTPGSWNLWRYADFLPLSFRPNGLGEGGTPLIDSGFYGERYGIDLKFKLDSLNPTGSFKDRGTAVSAAKAKEIGQSTVADDSSGNAGSSLAAYGSRLGLETVIYAPKGVPDDKLAQIEAYGARLKEIPGPRDEARRAIERDYKGGGFYYLSHNKNPFFLEGTKTLAFEIYEQLGGKVPDHLLIPVGGGSLHVGAYKGFRELKALGLLEGFPKIHCIQSAACDPLVEAFENGADEPSPVNSKETVAGGIHIEDPPRGEKVLEVLRETEGQGLSVPEEKILAARRELSENEGIYCEPTSAVTLLGLRNLLEGGIIGRDELIVLPITGSGLKDRRI